MNTILGCFFIAFYSMALLNVFGCFSQMYTREVGGDVRYTVYVT